MIGREIICDKCDMEITPDKKVFCADCYAIQNIVLNATFKRKVSKLLKHECKNCKRIGFTNTKGTGIKLTIHHTNYKDPDGDRYDLKYVELLCRECHDKLHGFDKSLNNNKII